MQADEAKTLTIKMLIYLDEHIGIDNSIMVDHVKKALGITDKENLNRACRQSLGVSSQKLILHLKMIKAYYFNHEKNLDEQTIADTLCYSDRSALCHAFKNYTHGQTLKSCQLKHLDTKLQFKIKSLIDSNNKTKKFLQLDFAHLRN